MQNKVIKMFHQPNTITLRILRNKTILTFVQSDLPPEIQLTHPHSLLPPYLVLVGLVDIVKTPT